MNKKIEFDYEGKHYTLEYNRNAVALIERQGFCIDELVKKPMSMLPCLLYTSDAADEL